MNTALPMRRLRAHLVLGVALAMPLAAIAHGGHDHEAAPKAAAGTAGRAPATAPSAAPAASPAPGADTAATGARLVASSEQFELVGVLDGRRLVLWLDRFADNAPVAGARIELEIGQAQVEARATGDTYVAELAEAPKAGRLPVAVTIAAGTDTDLLAAELVIPDAAAAVHADDAPATRLAPWAVAGALAIVAAIGVGLARSRPLRRRAAWTAPDPIRKTSTP